MATPPFICRGAALTCPGHTLIPESACRPPPVRVTEIDVISRQVPSLDRAYADLAESLIVRGSAESATPLNATLLLEVLAFLDRNPQRWTQHRYLAEVDGHLVGCVAGWAVVMGGVDFGDPNFILSAKDGIELHRLGREVLGLSEFQAGAVFGFTHGFDPGTVRHPTFGELCDRVFEVTHIRYTPQQGVAA